MTSLTFSHLYLATAIGYSVLGLGMATLNAYLRGPRDRYWLCAGFVVVGFQNWCLSVMVHP